MPPLPPVTQALILANVALFCIDYTLGEALSRWFALYPLQSPFFYPWQVVTYAFLHGSFAHIFFNMMGLWMFGSELERIWGSRRFAHFMLASILSAALIQLVFNFVGSLYAPTVSAFYVPTVGASGGVFGLLLAFAMMFPNRTIMPLFPPIPMKAKVFVAIYGALELFLGVTGTQSGVAHFAHLGGMLGGWLMLRYWRGQPPFKGMGGRRR